MRGLLRFRSHATVGSRRDGARLWVAVIHRVLVQCTERGAVLYGLGAEPDRLTHGLWGDAQARRDRPAGLGRAVAETDILGDALAPGRAQGRLRILNRVLVENSQYIGIGQIGWRGTDRNGRLEHLGHRGGDVADRLGQTQVAWIVSICIGRPVAARASARHSTTVRGSSRARSPPVSARSSQPVPR